MSESVLALLFLPSILSAMSTTFQPLLEKKMGQIVLDSPRLRKFVILSPCSAILLPLKLVLSGALSGYLEARFLRSALSGAGLKASCNGGAFSIFLGSLAKMKKVRQAISVLTRSWSRLWHLRASRGRHKPHNRFPAQTSLPTDPLLQLPDSGDGKFIVSLDMTLREWLQGELSGQNSSAGEDRLFSESRGW
jgi:hypothetical protein